MTWRIAQRDSNNDLVMGPGYFFSEAWSDRVMVAHNSSILTNGSLVENQSFVVPKLLVGNGNRKVAEYTSFFRLVIPANGRMPYYLQPPDRLNPASSPAGDIFGYPENISVGPHKETATLAQDFFYTFRDDPTARRVRLIPVSSNITRVKLEYLHEVPVYMSRINNNNVQIVQTRDTVVLHYEMIHEARVFRLGGGPHISSSIRQYIGDSRAHWDGDTLVVDMHDTADGFEVVIQDLTKGISGSMKASVANGFGHVNYAPGASTCTVTPAPFHPAYATSSEATRVVWAAHSYNVAFSDEIGHFEYCNAVNGQGGSCTSGGATDPGGSDADDGGCFAAVLTEGDVADNLDLAVWGRLQ